MAARWSESELETIRAHPDLTARELAALLPGRSEFAVRKQRERVGRWSRGGPGTCVACDERPVWEESRAARRMGLCKGCYLREERMRIEDEREADRVRHRRLRARGSRLGGGA